MNQFYVNLFSHKSDDLTSNGSFNTLLHKNIIGSYEVALVELSFPISWKVDLGTIKVQNKDTDQGEYVINLNNYDFSDLGEICNHIKYRFNSIPDEFFRLSNKFRPNIRYSREESSIKLWIDETIESKDSEGNKIIINSDKRLKIDNNFSKYFRFINDDKQFLFKYSHYHKSIVKINSLLYIYCDIICNQFDGNSKSKLLRTISVKGNAIDTCHYIFDNPHYCSLNKTNISSIELKIKDCNNRVINFLSGSIFVKLHFRKI